MEKHFDLSDLEFETKFRNCKLDPAVFSHEAHLRLAWLHIHHYGLEKAKENIQNQIQNFVKHVGAEDKYHSTLTVAAIEAVGHFMNQSSSNSFPDFIREFPQLKANFKELINSHYSFDIFSSEQARNVFIEPDLQAF